MFMTYETALERAKEWTQNRYYSLEARNEIQVLIDRDDRKEILDRFYCDLEFGTGGLRSLIAMGTNRMNVYNVRRATQALSDTVKKEFPDAKELRVAVSYDSRKFSLEFAREVCSVLAGNGIHAHIFSQLAPVPLLSYAVRTLKAHAGVMITASHNPKEYNGYKAYWSDGAQVTPPYDEKIIHAYENLKDWSKVRHIPFEKIEGKFIHWISPVVEQAYFSMLLEYLVNPTLCRNSGGDLKVIYTPIHGSGNYWCTEILKKAGFMDVAVVEEQKNPDSSFPTANPPNPENPKALALAVKLMKHTNADIALATDPDADRLGVALLHKDEVVYLNGNQIGSLLTHYILSGLSEQKRLPPHPLLIKTIVTSELQALIARDYGCKVENTLTGFKWIGRRILEIEQKHETLDFIFGDEESYGFLSHPNVRDKDAVNATLMTAEMALHYKKLGMTLMDALNSLYLKYGYFHEEQLSLNYEGVEGVKKIENIMQWFRSYRNADILGKKITSISDYEKSIVTSADNKKTPIDLPKSNVIAFAFDCGSSLVARPSGTEPKIKFYIMLRDTTGDLETRKRHSRFKSDEFKNFIRKTVEAL
jgi:phosphoglucomutase